MITLLSLPGPLDCGSLTAVSISSANSERTVPMLRVFLGQRFEQFFVCAVGTSEPTTSQIFPFHLLSFFDENAEELLRSQRWTGDDVIRLWIPGDSVIG